MTAAEQKVTVVSISEVTARPACSEATAARLRSQGYKTLTLASGFSFEAQITYAMGMIVANGGGPYIDRTPEGIARRERELAAIEARKVVEPPAGSLAATARVMAQSFPDFDWDAWKDEMKDAALLEFQS